MNFEKEPVKVYRVTIKKLLENLSSIKKCSLESFQDEIIDAFEGYDYEDVEEVTGFQKWPDISKDGKYELTVKVNHPQAYEITLFVNVDNNQATVENVL